MLATAVGQRAFLLRQLGYGLAAEGAYQAYAGSEAARLDVDGGALVLEQDCFGGQDLR